jgi:hypothetical protein
MWKSFRTRAGGAARERETRTRAGGADQEREIKNSSRCVHLLAAFPALEDQGCVGAAEAERI